MTSFRWTPPCPPVTQGDAQSYVLRARWIKEYGGRAREAMEPDIRRAIELDPSLWEPWSMLADLVSEDAALQLSCLENAVRRGAEPAVGLQRARLLLLLDRFAEAEQALGSLLEHQDTTPRFVELVREERASARVQLGDYAGAVEDLRPLPEHVSGLERERMGVYQWLAGDFASAHLTLTAQTQDRQERLRIWAHLCQVAHGLRHSAMPPPAGLDERPPVFLSGARIDSQEHDDQRECSDGLQQRSVWIWDALSDLFMDRITPEDLLAASQSALAESDAWRLPATAAGIDIYYFTRPDYVWRSQLLFYIGMWHLSKGDLESARQALSEASESDASRSLEKIAARVQLRRMACAVADGGTPFQALESAPPPPPPMPHPHLQKFVELQMTLPELWPTRAGPTLKFDEHTLGDEGLATLLASRNLRFVVRLLLQKNGITAAGMAAFRKSGHIVNLGELDLSGNPIGDDGVRHLLGSAALLALETLDLSDTGLTDAGALLFVDQQQLKLRRLILGDMPVDMPVWRKLIGRYGAGLFARGVFTTPYEPPFDPDLQVSFSSTASLETSGGAVGGRCELTFLMRDYLTLLWQWAAAGRSKTARWDRLSEVTRLHELERTLAYWTSKVYPIEGDGGFSMIFAGYRPLSLRCPACEVKYVWPKLEIEEGDESTPSRIKCPKGHQLN